MVEIFDIDSLIKKKNKALLDWHNHNFIFKQSAEIVFKKLNEINQNFKNILLITSDISETIEKISNLKFEKLVYLTQYESFLEDSYFKKKHFFKIISSFENIALKKETFDLVICNFCFHNINKKEEYIKNIFKILKNRGMLFCNFFGENSLNELHNCFLLTDEKLYNGSYLRFPPRIKMVGFSDLLSRIGFKEVVSEKINYEIYYKNVSSLLADIKGMGESCNMKKRKKSLLTKNYIQNLDNFYKKIFSDGKSNLKATCDIISTTCWKNN